MTERAQPSIPFVGLHSHSVFSIFDGMGYPQDHQQFAWENGMDALALTDHGNMSGLAYQVLNAKKMQAEGKNFKPIFGIEATKKRKRKKKPLVRSLKTRLRASVLPSTFSTDEHTLFFSHRTKQV